MILDNAPVSLVSDGILTSTHADSNLFLLREGYSNREQIKYINQLSESKTIEKIALIYNDTKKVGFGYGSKYSGYSYGGGYYDDKFTPRKKKFWKKYSVNTL